MTIGFDASSELEVTATLSDPTTWTHTPAGTPKGVLVGIVHDTTETDHVVGVTYGGVAMAEVTRVTVAGGKPGSAEFWFLGTGVPTGAKTVSVDLTGGAITDNAHFTAITFTGATDLEVVDFGIHSDTADNNPEITVASAGRTIMAVGLIYSGRNSPTLLTENGNMTRMQDMDMGAQSSIVARQTTPGASNFLLSWTALGAEVALIGVALSEVPSGAAPIRTHIVRATQQAVVNASRW